MNDNVVIYGKKQLPLENEFEVCLSFCFSGRKNTLSVITVTIPVKL